MAQIDSYLRSTLKSRHLHLLVALDDFRNLRLVADQAHVTQPAVSKALAELERGLGVQLFERTPLGMRPNAYGECLIRHARSVLHDLDQARDELRGLIAGTSGKVAVGASPGIIATLLPAALAKLKKQSPGTTVRVHEGTVNQLLPDLWQGQFDMVLGRLPTVRGTSGLEEQVLFEEPVMMVVGPHHPLAGRKKVDWRDLKGYPWVLPPRGALLREPLERELERHGIPMPTDYVETLSIHLTRAYLQVTDSISCLAGLVSSNFSTLNVLGILPLHMPQLARPQGATWNRQRPLSPGAKLLLDCLHETARAMSANMARLVSGPANPSR